MTEVKNELQINKNILDSYLYKRMKANLEKYRINIANVVCFT